MRLNPDSFFALPLPALLLVGAFMGGCAAEVDGSLPGSCSLQCSQKRVASADYILKPLTESIKLSCYGDFSSSGVVPLNGPVQVKYMIYEEVPELGPKKSEEGGGDAGSDSGSGSTVATKRVPRAGIGFEPWIMSAVAVEKTNEEHMVDGKASPFKFAGVHTPSSEWCSDSCGVMTYEYWPVCQSGASVEGTAGIAVSGVEAKGFTVVTTTNE